MAKKIFVSYNFNNKHVRDSVHNLLSEEQVKGQIKVVENDVSYNGETAIDWEIEHTMEKCDAALFVLGDKLRSSPWLEKEAAHAKALSIPVLATQIPGSDLDASESMAGVECDLLHWDAKSVADTLNRC